ncbi:hypothetical protein D3C77_673340 [compost metagenome]
MLEIDGSYGSLRILDGDSCCKPLGEFTVSLNRRFQNGQHRFARLHKFATIKQRRSIHAAILNWA